MHATGGGLQVGRWRSAGPVPTRGPQRSADQFWPRRSGVPDVSHWCPVQVLLRVCTAGERDREHRPQRTTRVQGRLVSAGGDVLPRSRYRRKEDPQLAKIYYIQMVERGANHAKALCVVAAHLAECAWAVMARGMPCVV